MSKYSGNIAMLRCENGREVCGTYDEIEFIQRCLTGYYEPAVGELKYSKPIFPKYYGPNAIKEIIADALPNESLMSKVNMDLDDE